MVTRSCGNPDCTFAQTGVCVLGNDPSACANIQVDEDKILVSQGDEYLEPVLGSPESKPTFPHSASLGLADVDVLMARERSHIIGILGFPDSGKTACLVSLYLSLANGKLNGFSFADSRSLMAFDELSRGARDWPEGIPDQMTAHTEVKDVRTAGFLHLRLCREADGEKFNIFLPDLPGEWSDLLIDKNQTERLSFLKSAASIWVMVDGNNLRDLVSGRTTTHRTKYLLNRLAEMLKPHLPSIRLVITRMDSGSPKENFIAEIQDAAIRFGITLEIDYIASFSNNPDIPPSSGISELISKTLSVNVGEGVFWPDEPSKLGSGRQMLKFSIEGKNG